MTTTVQNINAVPPPQSTGMIGTSPRNDSIVLMNQKANTLNNLAQVAGRKKRGYVNKNTWKGGGVVVAEPPNINLINDPAAGTSQSTVNQVSQNASVINQSNANAQYDNQVVLQPVPPSNPNGGARSRKHQRMKRNKSRKIGRKQTKSRKSRKSRKYRK